MSVATRARLGALFTVCLLVSTTPTPHVEAGPAESAPVDHVDPVDGGDGDQEWPGLPDGVTIPEPPPIGDRPTGGPPPGRAPVLLPPSAPIGVPVSQAPRGQDVIDPALTRLPVFDPFEATVDLAAGSPVSGWPLRVMQTPVDHTFPGGAAGEAKAPPDHVRVRGLASEDLAAAGLHAIGFTIGEASAVAADSAATDRPTVRVEIDYSSFRYAFGGDWASRLQLVALPRCVLVTPEVAQCRERTVVPSGNDVAHGVLTADVTVDASEAGGFGESRAAAGGASTVYGLEAGYTSLSGSYAATPTVSAGSWSVGTQMGSFNYSYRIASPPTGFGAAPAVGVGYSSQAIDGVTPDQNTQGGPIALGWSLGAGGFIDRTYKPCVDDGGAIQDFCWFSDNASITLNGQSSELIPTGIDDGTWSEWRLEQDPGWKVVRQLDFASSSTDARGEIWYVYTPDGTEYRFGQRREPTTNVDTNSVWYAPVYGNHAGEPCYPSWCSQAWRWLYEFAPGISLGAVGLGASANLHLITGGVCGQDGWSIGGSVVGAGGGGFSVGASLPDDSGFWVLDPSKTNTSISIGLLAKGMPFSGSAAHTWIMGC